MNGLPGSYLSTCGSAILDPVSNKFEAFSIMQSPALRLLHDIVVYHTSKVRGR